MKSKLLLLFFVFSFAFRSDFSFDQDLGRHIKLGEIILMTKEVPKINLFSYTNPDFPFINTHWLFGVIAYLFQISIGVESFLILKIIIFLVSVWLIFKIIPNNFSVILLPIGFLFLHVFRERLELRPEIFSFLFTSLSLYILEKFTKSSTKLIYLLPLIQMVWVNTHIYFFVGFVLQIIFLIHLGYKYFQQSIPVEKIKFLTLIILFSSLLSLINPNGLQGLLYPLNVNNNYGYNIVENQTIFFLESIGFKNPNIIYVKISAIIIIISIIFTLFRKHFEIKNILLPLLGLSLALLNVRSIPYLVFISLPYVVLNFKIVKQNLITKILFLFTLVILINESYSYLSGGYYKTNISNHTASLKIGESIKKAMDFVLINNLEGPIFNNFDIGSYITYRAHPRIKVFVDGRPEAYPKEFFQNFYIPMQYEYSKFKEEEENFGFKTVIFSHSDQTPWAQSFLKNITKDSSWTLVYLDDFMVVLSKTEIANEKKLQQIDLTKISVKDFKFDNYFSYLKLINFLLITENSKNVKEFLEKAKELNPQIPFEPTSLTI